MTFSYETLSAHSHIIWKSNTAHRIPRAGIPSLLAWNAHWACWRKLALLLSSPWCSTLTAVTSGNQLSLLWFDAKKLLARREFKSSSAQAGSLDSALGPGEGAAALTGSTRTISTKAADWCVNGAVNFDFPKIWHVEDFQEFPGLVLLCTHLLRMHKAFSLIACLPKRLPLPKE